MQHLQWFTKSAKQGNPKGAFYLGPCATLLLLGAAFLLTRPCLTPARGWMCRVCRHDV